MKKATAFLTLPALFFFLSADTAAGHAVRFAPLLNPSGTGRLQAPPQSANSPRWQSREEYDAFMAMTQQGKRPELQIALAEAFLQKFPRSDFRSGAYLTEMQCYYQLGKIDSAVDAANNALRLDRNNLDALTFLSYVFPFTFHEDYPTARSNLTHADNDAHHGLDVLRSLEKPANVSPEQFLIYVKTKRVIFNGTVGFVALQRHDCPSAISALQAAVADDPANVLAFYRLGLAYLYSTPADYDHGIWYVARAVGLARAAKNPAGDDVLRYLRKVFVQSVGSDAAVEDTITHSLASVNPPDISERPVAPRGGMGPGQNGTASAAHNPNPSGPSATGQAGKATVYRVYAPIYPTWLAPSDNGSEDQAPPPPAPMPDDQIAAQLNYLATEMSRAGQEQAWQYASASVPPEPPEPEPAPPPTVLVYKDGHQEEVQNYAIVGEYLVWFSGQLSKKIPLADLDLPATRKVNEGRGTAFAVPGAP